MKRIVSDVIQRVLMVRPRHFEVKGLAMKQWTNLKGAIEAEGVEVLTLEQAEGAPDMVFVCNSGLVLDKRVYLSKFRHPERTPEQNHYLKWFKENGYELLGADYPHVFEGGGDCAFSDYDTLWAGYGARTEKGAYAEVAKLGQFETVMCEMVDPQFYHLDTCLAPIGNKHALWYPPAFSEATQREIAKRLPLAIAVSPKEASAFVCNSMAVRKTVISPVGMAQKTKDALSSIGYKVVEVDTSEFIKAGGSVQCLVLKL